MVLEPYREAFNDKHEGCMTGGDIPPHRVLFHAYTYQYHLMEFSIILIGTVSVALPPLFALKVLSARIYHTPRKGTVVHSTLASLGILSRLFPLEHMGSQCQSRARG
jgi:hypothetical protein